MFGNSKRNDQEVMHSFSLSLFVPTTVTLGHDDCERWCYWQARCQHILRRAINQRKNTRRPTPASTIFIKL